MPVSTPAQAPQFSFLVPQLLCLPFIFFSLQKYLKREDFLGHYSVSMAVMPLTLSFGTLSGQWTNAEQKDHPSPHLPSTLS